MSIRTGTEEKLQKPCSSESTVLCGKAVSLVGTSSHRLFVHPSHLAVAEHHSQEPFHPVFQD